jgi:hypothetical protein
MNSTKYEVSHCANLLPLLGSNILLSILLSKRLNVFFPGPRVQSSYSCDIKGHRLELNIQIGLKLEEQVVTMSTGFIWLRIATNVEIL